MLQYWTAGESHGQGLLALVNGFPAGVPLKKDKISPNTENTDRFPNNTWTEKSVRSENNACSENNIHSECNVQTENGTETENYFCAEDKINAQLRRRQGGYGRGGRQKIESDHVQIQTGICKGISTGSPIALWIPNADYKIDQMPELTAPRPGHGDLTGSMKFMNGIRPILERASARETAARVAAGALAQILLEQFNIFVTGYVVSIGSLNLSYPSLIDTKQNSVDSGSKNTSAKNKGYSVLDNSSVNMMSVDDLSTNKKNTDNSSIDKISVDDLSVEEIIRLRSQSEVYSLVPKKDTEAKALIDQCKEAGDTLGGIVEVRVQGLPFGLGTHTQWSEKLDGNLAKAVMSVQAIKGVEIGLGFEAARRFGSQVHDPIQYSLENRQLFSDQNSPNNKQTSIQNSLESNHSHQTSTQTASDQTISTQTASDQTISAQTISDQTVSAQTISDQTASAQTISAHTILAQTASDQTTSAQTILGQTVSDRWGVRSSDTLRQSGFYRPTNNAGGLEAGMTNSEPIVLRAAMKPIATLKKPLESVDLSAQKPFSATYERSDVCAVSATSVVLECVVAFEIAAAFIEKFGGDSLDEMKERYKLYLQMTQEYLNRLASED